MRLLADFAGSRWHLKPLDVSGFPDMVRQQQRGAALLNAGDCTVSPFGIRPNQRVAVFIDGVSIFHTARLLGWEVNYKSLRQHFDENADLYRISYFTTLPESPQNGEEEAHNPVIKLVDWLTYNGYRTLVKSLPVRYDTEGRQRIKGSMNVEIAVEMLEAVTIGAADHIILFAATSELTYAVEAVQRRGAKVTLASSVRSEAEYSLVSDELRRTADWFIDINEKAVRDIMARPSNPRGRDTDAPVATFAPRVAAR